LLYLLPNEDVNHLLNSGLAPKLKESKSMEARKQVSEDLKHVLGDPFHISNIMNSGIRIQMLAVRLNHMTILSIGKPFLCVYQYVVNANPDMLSKIKNVPLSVQMLAVEKDGLLIRHIEKPEMIVQFLAVQENPESIKYINDPCPEVIGVARSRMGQKGEFFKKWFEKKFTTCPLRLSEMAC